MVRFCVIKSKEGEFSWNDIGKFSLLIELSYVQYLNYAPFFAIKCPIAAILRFLITTYLTFPHIIVLVTRNCQVVVLSGTMKLEALQKNDWKIHAMYVMVTSEAYQNCCCLTLLWNVLFKQQLVYWKTIFWY